MIDVFSNPGEPRKRTDEQNSLNDVSWSIHEVSKLCDMADENIVSPVYGGETGAAGIALPTQGTAIAEAPSRTAGCLAKHKKASICALIFTVALVISVVAALPFIRGNDSTASSGGTVEMSFMNTTNVEIDVGDGDGGGAAALSTAAAHTTLLQTPTAPSDDGRPTTTATTTTTPLPCALLQVEASEFTMTPPGVARLFLHTAEKTWDKDYGMTNRAFLRSSKLIEDTTVSWNLLVPAGTYGVMVLDDIDRNGEMKRNWLGIPKEGVGSSRGAKGGAFGGPKFDDAKVTIDCNQTLTLTVDLWAI